MPKASSKADRAFNPDEDGLLTLAEVAERLGRHPKTLKRMLPDLRERYPALQWRVLGRSILRICVPFDGDSVSGSVEFVDENGGGAGVRLRRLLAGDAA